MSKQPEEQQSCDKQEPVSRILSQQEMALSAKRYTTPPQHILMAEYWKNQYEELKAKQWVGLTEEDIDDAEIHLTSCRNNHESWIEGIQEFAQAIEAKLKEKNT